MEKPTKEMYDFFDKRTNEHIKKVKQNAKTLSQALPELKALPDHVKEHDKSKFEKNEKEAYVWLTEYFRAKDEGRPFQYPEGVKEEVDKAIGHHKSVNPHHPEFHGNTKSLSDLDLAEMVCDWYAVSQEKGTNCRPPFGKTI